MFKEMFQIALKANFEGYCIPQPETLCYAFTSREEPNAAPVTASKIRWFSRDGDKFTIHTMISPDGAVVNSLRAELLYQDEPGTFIDSMVQGVKVKRLKASNLTASTFAARFYGLEGTNAEKFASLLMLSNSPATVEAITRGEIEDAYAAFNSWSVSCMTTRSERVEIYDSSTDCAVIVVRRGEEKMGRVVIFRPRQLDSWQLNRDEPLEREPTSLSGWYYTRVYGRGLHCGFTDAEGENYTRRAIEALGCRPGTEVPDGEIVCLSSSNDRAPWFDEYGGATICYDGDAGRKCVVAFNHSEPAWVRSRFERFENNLRLDTFSHEEDTRCACCGESFDAEECGAYVEGTGDVCPSCLDDSYTYVEDVEQYVCNDDVAQLCDSEEYVVSEDYVGVERPHRSGCWVCAHGDEVEIDGELYYGPDIESGAIRVLDYMLRPRLVGNEFRLFVERGQSVSEHTLDMELDGDVVKVGILWDTAGIVSYYGDRLVLVAPMFGTRDDDFIATMWREDDGQRSQMRLTRFGSCYPVLVNEEWTVVSTGGRSGSWVVGDQLSRYTEHRAHTWSTMTVDGVTYTVLGDMRSNMSVRSHNDRYGPTIIHGDRPYCFQYGPGHIPEFSYQEETGHYCVNENGYNRMVNCHADCRNGFHVYGYCSSYGATKVLVVTCNDKLIQLNHLEASVEFVANHLKNIDTAEFGNGSVEDLTVRILAALTS